MGRGTGRCCRQAAISCKKAGCNVDAPLGPEQDLKLLFLCNPKDPLRISVQITLDYVQFWQVWWAMGLPLHLAVAHHTPPPPPPFPSQLAMCRLPPEGVPPACTWRVERGMGGGGGRGGGVGWATAKCKGNPIAHQTCQNC